MQEGGVAGAKCLGERRGESENILLRAFRINELAQVAFDSCFGAASSMDGHL